MASRKSTRCDQVAPAPDRGTEAVGVSPSAPASQPVKEAGRGGALRARQLPSSASPLSRETDVSSSSSSSTSAGKRARLHSPARTGDAQSNAIMQDVLNQPWSLMDDGEDVEEVKEEPASASPPLSATKSADSASNAVPHERDYAPSYVGKLKLFEVGLDPRMDTVLVVTFNVDAAMPSPPQVERARMFLSKDVKRKLAASLLGSPTGFDIILPDIPRILVSGGTTEAAIANCNHLTGPKAEWWSELRRMTQKHGGLVSQLESDDGARVKACDELWEHLEKVNPKRSIASTDQLWSTTELTTSWADLLAPLSEIMSDRVRGPSSGRSYQLKLHGVTPEVTYIIACLITSYATLRDHDTNIAAAFQKELHGSSSAAAARAAKTDSESGSDGEDGWRTAHRARRSSRPGFSLEKRLAAFAVKHLSTERYRADSRRPALQLATTVHMRPWEHHFISCDVSNWESVGCSPDEENLAATEIYKKVTTAIPELCPPIARWVVHQHCGFYTVNLFLREDCKDVVAKLNERLRTALAIPSMALGVTCWVARRRGWRIVDNTQMKISLTPEVPRRPSPQQLRRVHATASSDALTPPADSFAGRVLEGIRRAAPVHNLDHRPRKEQRPSMSAAQPAAQNSTPATTAPTRRVTEQHTTASTSLARQRSVNSVTEPRSAHETQLPPALASLRKMVEDSNRRIDALLDIPRQVHALSGRLVQMEMASTASTEVMTTIQTKMEQIAFSMVALHEEVRRLSAAYLALPSIGAAVPVQSPLSVTDATMVPHELTYAAVAATQRAAVDVLSASPRSNPVSVMATAPAGAGPLYSSGQHVHGSPIAANSASASPARQNGSAVRNG
jgi:hypothetical protein